MSANQEVKEIKEAASLLGQKVDNLTKGGNLLFDSLADAIRREAKRTCHSRHLVCLLLSTAERLDKENSPYTIVDVIDERV